MKAIEQYFHGAVYFSVKKNEIPLKIELYREVVVVLRFFWKQAILILILKHSRE